jgi:hypothetical protein
MKHFVTKAVLMKLWGTLEHRSPKFPVKTEVVLNMFKIFVADFEPENKCMGAFRVSLSDNDGNIN